MGRIAHLHRGLAAASATISLLVVAGCGGDDAQPDAGASPPSASPGTSVSALAGDVPSLSPNGTAVAPEGIDVAAEPKPIAPADFRAVMATALQQATTAKVTLSSGSLGLSGTGEIDYTAASPATAMTVTLPQVGELEVRLVDEVIYVKGSLFGDRFVSIPLDDPNSPLGAIGDQLDPATSFLALEQGITAATYDGKVDGQDHYTVSVDSAALLNTLPEESQNQGLASLPPTVEYQWWFDEQGRFTRFSTDLGEAGGTVEGTFADWGSDVTIQAPPADQVQSLGAFTGSG